MSIRSTRALGALAAAALSCLSVIGLQATAASAVEAPGDPLLCERQGELVDCSVIELPELPDRTLPPLPSREYDPSTPRFPDDQTENDYGYAPSAAGVSHRPVEVTPPVIEAAGDPRPTGRPVEVTPPSPWCMELGTGEIFECTLHLPAWQEDAAKPMPGNDHDVSPAAADTSGSPASVASGYFDEGWPVGRPTDGYSPMRPIWCTDLETGEISQCGWQGGV